MFGVLDDNMFEFEVEEIISLTDDSIIITKLKELFLKLGEIIKIINKKDIQINTRVDYLEKRVQELEETLKKCIIID